MSLELSGTVQFYNGNKDAASTRYQHLYSGQQYGTFFAIYGQFETTCDIEKNTFSMTNAQFMLMNYKGVVNLGIKTIKKPSIKSRSVVSINGNSKTVKCLQFELDLVGLSSSMKVRKTPKFSLKNILVTDIDYLLIEPSLKPLTKGVNPMYSDTLFDTENYYRNGMLYEKKNKLSANASRRISSAGIGITEAPYGSCIGGYSRIVIAK